MKEFVTFIGCLLLARVVFAQTYYVRQGGGGAADGSDWANAYPDLPASLKRGATYYVAAGSYAGHTFNDPESGTSMITVKKATVADHGAATGWTDTYAASEALFTGSLVFVSGYYTIDGETGGGPGSWESGFGIRIHPTDAYWLISIAGPNSNEPPMPGHFVFRHIDLQGAGFQTPFVAQHSDGVTARLFGNTTLTGGVHNLTFQYCYIHDTMEGMASFGFTWLSGFLLEDSEVARNWSTPANHSEAVYAQYSNDLTFRYDRFVDIIGTAVIAIQQGDATTTYNNNIDIYGNIVFCTSAYAGDGVGEGIVSNVQHTGTETTTNVRVYNNTIVGCTQGITWGINLPNGTGHEVYNNLWVNSATSVGVGTNADDVEDDNTLINCTYRPNWFTGTNDAIYASGDPFTNETAGDFQLSAPTDPGLALAAPYNVDMFGHTTRADGSWDRGALQYTDGSANPPGADGGNLPTGDVPAGCACNASGAEGSEGGIALLFAFVGWCGSRRCRRLGGAGPGGDAAGADRHGQGCQRRSGPMEGM